MGCTKEATLYSEGDRSKGICVVCGGPIHQCKEVDGFFTQKHDRYKFNYRSVEGGDARNINIISSDK